MITAFPVILQALAENTKMFVGINSSQAIV